MTNILAKSALESNHFESLLNKDVPSYRQAYSDRTAWIMACLSELAYIRFNPLFSNNEHKDYFLDRISELLNENKESSLMKLIDLVGYDHNQEKKKLKSEKEFKQGKLVKTIKGE